ncbi:MAG: RnfABCDGE type electron transport complex subunit D [Clostridia bacterium]
MARWIARLVSDRTAQNHATVAAQAQEHEPEYETTQVIETDPGAALLVTPGPHIHDTLTAQGAMLSVIAALLPATGVAIYLFGLPALWVVVASITGAMATEALCQWARKRPITLWDGSAALTGLLLALTLPPTLPPWMAVLGAAVAIGVGKHAFGGLGANPFNPALVGRAFLGASFAAPMSAFALPFDTVTGATPLAEIAATGTYSDLWALFAGTTGGSLGETSAVALLAGGAALLWRGVIDWRIPAGIGIGTAAVAWIAGVDPVAHLLSGGLLLGAIFMATDWVTSPITRKGKWIYALSIGVLTMVIRLWAAAPEGVSFAILVMNGATPLINALTRPKGSRKR